MFAYGQTGSGKTHTMSGYENIEGAQSATPQLPRTRRTPDLYVVPFSESDTVDGFKYDTNGVGVIPRSARYIFEKLREQQDASPDIKATVVATFCEVYNEKVRYPIAQHMVDQGGPVRRIEGGGKVCSHCVPHP